MFQTWNLFQFWGHGLRMFNNISPAFEMTVDTSAAARVDVQPFVSPLTSHTVWKHLQQFMQCRGQSMPNWSHQRDWAKKVINENLTVLKVNQKMDLYLKKVDIYISYSVSRSLQPTNPKQTPHRCCPDTLSLRSPTKNGENNFFGVRRGHGDGDGDGRCRNGWHFFSSRYRNLILKTWDLLDDLEMPPEFVGWFLVVKVVGFGFGNIVPQKELEIEGWLQDSQASNKLPLEMSSSWCPVNRVSGVEFSSRSGKGCIDRASNSVWRIFCPMIFRKNPGEPRLVFLGGGWNFGMNKVWVVATQYLYIFYFHPYYGRFPIWLL